jgi:tight adherence protein C
MMLLPLVLAGVFVTVMVLVLVVATQLTGSTAAGRRLFEVTRVPLSAPTIAEILPLQTDKPAGEWEAVRKLVPKSPAEIGRLRSRLLRAGIKDPNGPAIFSLLEIAGPVLLALPAYAALSGPYRWFTVAAAAIVGFFGPGYMVERWIKQRQRDIQNGLPDALDLLVVCIEAGSGLDQAIVKATDELSLSYPALSEELRQLNTEIRAGKPRIEAFKSLAQRTKVEDVRQLVAMLIQTDRFGTSVGQALRTHSETSRSKRRQRAEETAQKIGVKLVFPLVLFFFPAFYVVVLGPAIITFFRNFGG